MLNMNHQFVVVDEILEGVGWMIVGWCKRGRGRVVFKVYDF